MYNFEKIEPTSFRSLELCTELSEILDKFDDRESIVRKLLSLDFRAKNIEQEIREKLQSKWDEIGRQEMLEAEARVEAIKERAKQEKEKGPNYVSNAPLPIGQSRHRSSSRSLNSEVIDEYNRWVGTLDNDSLKDYCDQALGSLKWWECQQYRLADFPRWQRQDYWKLSDAILLICGLDPEKFRENEVTKSFGGSKNPHLLARYRGFDKTPKKIDDLMKALSTSQLLAQSSICGWNNNEKVFYGSFPQKLILDWCQEKGFEITCGLLPVDGPSKAELSALLASKDLEIADFRREIQELRAAVIKIDSPSLPSSENQTGSDELNQAVESKYKRLIGVLAILYAASRTNTAAYFKGGRVNAAAIYRDLATLTSASAVGGKFYDEWEGLKSSTAQSTIKECLLYLDKVSADCIALVEARLRLTQSVKSK